jgi:hypothetical protein
MVILMGRIVGLAEPVAWFEANRPAYSAECIEELPPSAFRPGTLWPVVFVPARPDVLVSHGGCVGRILVNPERLVPEPQPARY